MFRVINFTYLLRYVAITTTALSIFAYWGAERVLQSELPIVRLLSVAPWVVLIVILAITTNSTSRAIWKFLKKFNSSLYPDLNGTWEGEIALEDGRDPPPLKWSAVMFRKRRIENGKQAAEAGRDCLEVAAG
ncbi:hypothetical protein D2T33_21120 [Sinirhodobacter populi]|uniref:SMODS-associating 2TM beta-strand rich effector domain-containing protein n=1 Tax=Paenirhodobacter populi TaxID=2306993 RepID=A0A443IJ30_9RHOB|nr:hypothetical protein D2T33_21120 [Sinirhodobacter populi]